MSHLMNLSCFPRKESIVIVRNDNEKSKQVKFQIRIPRRRHDDTQVQLINQIFRFDAKVGVKKTNSTV